MDTSTATAARQIIVNKNSSGVTYLILDCQSKFNSLTNAVTLELEQIIDTLAKDAETKAIVCLSGKKDSFIIGADLGEIRKAKSEEELYRLSANGQRVLNKIADFPKPIIAAIHGTCLGGGLEITLACHKRIATKDKCTILGLPETRLGILPGLGGTQRLPRLIGLKEALAMILSADPISAHKALEIKLVDELIDSDNLLAGAEKLALLQVGKTTKSVENNAELTEDQTNKLLALTERSIRIKTRGNYPAQTQVIEVIKHGLKYGMKEGLDVEAQAFAKLAISDTANNLMSLFFSTDFARQSLASLAAKFTDNKIKNIVVIGAGTMGIGIASLLALNNFKVFLKTRDDNLKAIEQVKLSIQRIGVRILNTTDNGMTNEIAIDNVASVINNEQLANADLVIESVVEDFDVKTKILKEISELVPENCLIATNTSSLPLKDLSNAVKNKEYFLGLHFFHPVDKMPLVEIVSHEKTVKPALAKAACLVSSLDKTAVLVKDSPGYLINRILTRYLLETASLAQEEIPLNWIEQAALEFGMPMGPLELLDEVGLDIALKVARSLNTKLDNRMELSPLLNQVEDLGITGKKSGNGIYLWDSHGKRGNLNPLLIDNLKLKVSSEKAGKEVLDELSLRLILPMIDEAAYCLSEKIVSKAREIDMALVLGIGFPPFRGGLLKYADSIGIKEINNKLRSISSQLKNNKAICPLLQKYEDENRSFYALGQSN
jgi:3-hydroxyacyl-CoA dehydrogenase/enoyl-CoA hydratase/3-hydroxybutyryl-CoA epimerase